MAEYQPTLFLSSPAGITVTTFTGAGVENTGAAIAQGDVNGSCASGAAGQE